MRRLAHLLVLLVLPVCTALPQELPASQQLTDRMLELLMATDNDAEREAPLAEMLREAEALRQAQPASLEVQLAVTRIRFRYADTQGLFDATRHYKLMRAELEQVIAQDSRYEQGYAQALLGYLYHAVPPWPVSWRDADKGDARLLEALAIGPDSAYNNFFHGMVRVTLGDREVGIMHLEKAREVLVAQPVRNTEERFLLQGTETLLAEHRGQD